MATRKEHDAEFVERDANEDPITGEHGSHPVGTGVGATLGGAAAGAAGGAVAGPVGAVVGAIAGGVAGGYAGKGVAEEIDPTVEHSYWKENYRDRDYYQEGRDYDVYAPAYQYGWESRAARKDERFEDVEADLEREWCQTCGESGLSWEEARPASRDAWERTDEVYYNVKRKPR